MRKNLSKKEKRLTIIIRGMKQRCYNPNHTFYKYYGGKGVTIYDKWLNDENLFIEWALNNGYKDLLTIDRTDSEGNYTPENCTWKTRGFQVRTIGKRKNNSTGFKGVCKRPGGKYQASICVDKKVMYLGLFETKYEAARVYDQFIENNNLEHIKNSQL